MLYTLLYTFAYNNNNIKVIPRKYVIHFSLVIDYILTVSKPFQKVETVVLLLKMVFTIY